MIAQRFLGCRDFIPVVGHLFDICGSGQLTAPCWDLSFVNLLSNDYFQLNVLFPSSMHHENETAPLLGPRRSRSPLRPQNPHLATFLLSLCIFFLSGATAIVQVPLTQLMEDNLCDRYLGEIGRQDSIDRAICKADGIQSKLAYLNASFGVIESVTSMSTTVTGPLTEGLGELICHNRSHCCIPIRCLG